MRIRRTLLEPGSPPLTRGPHFIIPEGGGSVGITPAHAGTTKNSFTLTEGV